MGIIILEVENYFLGSFYASSLCLLGKLFYFLAVILVLTCEKFCVPSYVVSLNTQHHGMGALIQLYFDLRVEYADVVFMLNEKQGYAIIQTKLKAVLRVGGL